MSKHLRYVDLYNTGTEHEVLVVKYDQYNGDLHFIKVTDLDDIDSARMRNILRRRGADQLELWDLLDQITLKNGVNALEYFHQITLVRTQSGEISRPDARRRGVRIAQRQVVQTEQAEVPAPVKQGKRAPKADETE